jgi:hypothetical protein
MRERPELHLRGGETPGSKGEKSRQGRQRYGERAEAARIRSHDILYTLAQDLIWTFVGLCSLERGPSAMLRVNERRTYGKTQRQGLRHGNLKFQI